MRSGSFFLSGVTTHMLVCLLSLAGPDVPPKLLLKQRDQALEAEGVLWTRRLHVRLTLSSTLDSSVEKKSMA